MNGNLQTTRYWIDSAHSVENNVDCGLITNNYYFVEIMRIELLRTMKIFHRQ